MCPVIASSPRARVALPLSPLWNAPTAIIEEQPQVMVPELGGPACVQPHFDRVSENLRRTYPLACLSHYPDRRHHIMVTIVASPHGLLKAGGAEARTDMMLYLSIHLFRALSIWDIETLNDA